jgi:hypothetical protein
LKKKRTSRAHDSLVRTILAPHQCIEQPSIVTMNGGMWEQPATDEEQEVPGEDPSP